MTADKIFSFADAAPVVLTNVPGGRRVRVQWDSDSLNTKHWPGVNSYTQDNVLIGVLRRDKFLDGTVLKSKKVTKISDKKTQVDDGGTSCKYITAPDNEKEFGKWDYVVCDEDLMKTLVISII